MRLSVDHHTSYHYDSPLDYALQQLRLTPKARPGQIIHDWSITIEGGQKQLHYTDHNANQVDLISVDPGSHRVGIHCRGEVEVLDSHGVVGTHSGFMPLWTFLRPTALTRPGKAIRSLVAQLGRDHEIDITRAHDLSALITDRLPYATGQTGAETTGEQAMAAAGGVCQDHAHIFISAMRLLGHPARYVSGYLLMNDREQQDATHAWAEAHFDHIGWVGFDVSNGYSPDERYIRVATGLDYLDAAPARGMRYGAAQENLVVQLQVQQ